MNHKLGRKLVLPINDGIVTLEGMRPWSQQVSWHNPEKTTALSTKENVDFDAIFSKAHSSRQGKRSVMHKRQTNISFARPNIMINIAQAQDKNVDKGVGVPVIEVRKIEFDRED